MDSEKLYEAIAKLKILKEIIKIESCNNAKAFPDLQKLAVEKTLDIIKEF